MKKIMSGSGKLGGDCCGANGEATGWVENRTVFTFLLCTCETRLHLRDGV